MGGRGGGLEFFLKGYKSIVKKKFGGEGGGGLELVKFFYKESK